MELSLQILIGITALICFSGGINVLVKGAMYFLPKGTTAQPVLDDLVRFLGGIYFGMGFLLAWVVFDIERTTDLIYFIGLVVVFSGLGRLYSRIKLGSAGRYFDFIMSFEIILGLCIIVLEYLR